MHKVYLLLRNNRQSGPYSLEELLQLNLKPFDLVWVEGRSAAWRYPAEIDTLQPYVTETPRPEAAFIPVATEKMEEATVKSSALQSAPPAASTPKKVFVSLPGKAPQVPLQIYEDISATSRPASPEPVSLPHNDPLEEKAAAIARRVQEYREQNIKGEIPVETRFKRGVDEVESDYTNWVYLQRNNKKKILRTKDLAVAAGILALIVAGYFLLSKPALIQPGYSGDSQAVSAAGQDMQNKISTGSSNINEIKREASPSELANELASEKARNQTKPEATKQPASQPLPSANPPAEPNVKTGTRPVVTDEEPVKTEEHPNTVVEKEAVPQEQKKEKKKLRDFVRDLFGKKDKKETAGQEPVEESPKPATNRQAQKRGETRDNHAEMTNDPSLAQQVVISSNAPDNWMMGISGLKITLQNRNEVPLQTAAVNVLYYDEYKRLLDKKVVYFHQVPARGKMTLAAPDHKFADHVDLQLGAVSGRDDRYARDK